jgi:hypothetical protein
MNLSQRPGDWFRPRRSLLCLAILASQCRIASAQAPSTWARLFLQPSAALAQLEEVQKELKLDDKQKEQVAELNKELNEQRMAIFQDAGGDRTKIRERLATLYRENTEKLDKELDDAQRKRSHELYVQLNGPIVLQGDVVADRLKLTDEQKTKIQETLDRVRADWMNAGLRDLGEEEAAKKTTELTKSRDEKLLAVLTDDQRAEFEKMKGKELKVDFSKMPRPGRP